MLGRTIIYDLDENDKIISALACNKYCIGCFSCWINTPTKCILNDNFQYLKESNELIIINECRYGCYSTPIKRVLERFIGYVLPYFTIRNKEVHHQSGYDNRLKLTVYYYVVF